MRNQEKVIEAYDSKDYRQYTFKSEFDKIIQTLEGILIGISIDNDINPQELAELQNWCRLHKKYIDKYPFKEIIPAIENSIRDNTITDDGKEDILWLCNNFKCDGMYYDIVTLDIQKLHGILHGILADNQIDDNEIYGLKNWLNENEHLLGTYPYDEIYSLITSVLSDGIIDDHERKLLKVYFSEFIDLKDSYNINSIEISHLKSELKITGICSVCPNIVIKDNLFCFTGVSTRTTRTGIKDIIESLGGLFNNNVINNTNYLVIGNDGNPCWAFACYGRKVEKAMQLRKDGKQILIIHENDFWDAVEDLSTVVNK